MNKIALNIFLSQNTHMLKFIILTIFSSIALKFIHLVVQPLNIFVQAFLGINAPLSLGYIRVDLLGHWYVSLSFFFFYLFIYLFWKLSSVFQSGCTILFSYQCCIMVPGTRHPH